MHRTAARKNRRTLAIGGAVATAVLLASCSSPSGDVTSPDDAVPADGGSGVHVVATTTMLGDVAGRVVDCGGGTVETLMPVGADPHDYSPSSSAVRSLVEADLVIANGLGLEEGLTSALASAEQDGAVVLEIAPLVDPIPFGGGEHVDSDHAEDAEDDHGHDEDWHDEDGHDEDEHAEDGAAHSHGSEDPHVWLDVARMADAAALVGIELATITGDAAFQECGTTVAEDLSAVDAEIREILSAVPADDRRLVTDHDAFGYFAESYGFQVVGVVVPGGSTLADTSSAALAALADTVRTTGTPAVFANVEAPSALVDALAAEVGHVAVVPLHVGSLGPQGSDAEDYASMMLTNARLIAAALAG